jgi:hypothetical protein
LKESDKIKKDWKFYLGITFLILSFIVPFMGFIVPLFGLGTTSSAILIGLFAIGGPELMMLLAVVFLGKRMMHLFKKAFYKIFKRKAVVRAVSRTRHYFGLVLLFGSVVPLYLNAYLIDYLPKDIHMRHYVLVGADLVFILSFFILGGDFWENFKNLLKWKDPTKKR